MAKIRTSGMLASIEAGASRITIPTFLSRLMVWRWRVQYRRELATLTARQMHDTGLDPDIVWRESKKSFWEA